MTSTNRYQPSPRARLRRSLPALCAALFLLLSTAAAAQEGGPDVIINPGGGTYTSTSGVSVAVTIMFTHPEGLNAASRQVRLWSGSSSVAVSLTWTSSLGGAQGTLTGQVQLHNVGANVLKAQIADVNGNVGMAEATFTLARPPVSGGEPVLSLAPYHTEFRNTAQGALVLSYQGPSYTSMGATRAATFIYNSEQAKPSAFVQVDAHEEWATGSEYNVLSLRLEGETQNPDGTYPLVGREYFYVSGPHPWQRLSAYMPMTNQPTGVYRYWAVVRAYRPNGTYTQSRAKVRILIINESNSRYGAGWSLAIPRIHPHPLGAMLNEGNGIARWFQKSSTGSYDTPAGDFSTLARDAASQWVRTYPDGSKLTFNADGYLLRAEDRFGRATTYEWTSAKGISRIIDPVGTQTTFNYLANGYLGSITALGRTVYCTYDGIRLNQISGATTRMRMGYVTGENLIGYFNTSFDGTIPSLDGIKTTAITYDSYNRVYVVTSPQVVANGVAVRPFTSMQSIEGVVALRDGVGAALGTPAAAINAETVTLTMTDPEGHQTIVALDRYGQATKITANGLTTTTTYNVHGLPEIVIVDNGDRASTNVWNAKGQLTQTIVSGAIVYEATYSSNRNLLTKEIAAGATTNYEYDLAGQLVRSWIGDDDDRERNATTYGYNSRFELIRVTGPKGGKTTWSYDGNPWRNADWVKTLRQDNTIVQTSFAYDGYGRTQSVTDPLGRVSTFEYDTHGRTTKATDALNRVTTLTYAREHLAKVVHPAGTYEFVRNALGWIEAEKFSDGTQRLFTYDRDGQVTSRTDRRGRKVDYAYDAAHRLYGRSVNGIAESQFRYPDQYTMQAIQGESTVTIKTLPEVGAIDMVSTTLAGRTFELKSVRNAAGGWRGEGTDIRILLNGTLVKSDSIRHNSNFNPADPSLGGTYSVVDPSGRTTVLSFDNAGRNYSTTFGNGIKQINYFRTDDLLEKTTFSSSAANLKLGAHFAYDLFGRLQARTNAPADTMLGYNYDEAGRLTQYERFRSFNPIECDTTTRDDCPEPSWVLAAATSFTYNAADNRTDRGAAVYAGSNRYQTFDGFTLTYDAEGNLIRKVKVNVLDQVFEWNDMNQLASVTTNGAVVRYGYDALGRRVRRTENGTPVYFLYENDDLLMEIDANGNPFRTYTYLPGTDRPLSVRLNGLAGEFVYYYTMEHPGHVRGLLSTSGAVAAEYRYAPFGEPELATSIADQPLRFMARELDSKTGLYYVRNRWYDPVMGRFISEDPIGMAGGMNTYAYAGNDPVNRRDPSGLSPECPNCLPTIVVECNMGRYDPRCDPWSATDEMLRRWANERFEQDRYSPGDYLRDHNGAALVRPDPVGMGGTRTMPPPAPSTQMTIGPAPLEELFPGLEKQQQCRFMRNQAASWSGLEFAALWVTPTPVTGTITRVGTRTQNTTFNDVPKPLSGTASGGYAGQAWAMYFESGCGR